MNREYNPRLCMSESPMAAIWDFFLVLTLQILYNVPLINIKLECAFTRWTWTYYF